MLGMKAASAQWCFSDFTKSQQPEALGHVGDLVGNLPHPGVGHRSRDEGVRHQGDAPPPVPRGDEDRRPHSTAPISEPLTYHRHRSRARGLVRAPRYRAASWLTRLSGEADPRPPDRDEQSDERQHTTEAVVVVQQDPKTSHGHHDDEIEEELEPGGVADLVSVVPAPRMPVPGGSAPWLVLPPGHSVSLPSRADGVSLWSRLRHRLLPWGR